MKRWLLGLLLLLAVVILLSPGLIGLIAERQVDTRLQPATVRMSGAATTEHFERRWFTSEGLHRVPLTDPALRGLLRLLVPELPALSPAATLLIETRMRHGLLPAGSLTPALVSGTSTLTVDDANGERRTVPGDIHSRLGLNGRLTARYRLAAGNRRMDSTSAHVQDGEIVIGSATDGRNLTAELRLDGARLGDHGQQLGADRLQIAVDGHASEFGFPVGAATLRAENLQWLAGPDPAAIGDLQLAGRAGLDGDRVNAGLVAEVADMAIGADRYALSADLRLDGLRAARLGDVLRRLRQGSASHDEGLWHPFMDADLRALLSDGASLTVNTLLLSTPQGDIRVVSSMSLPTLGRTRAWPGLLLGMSGTATLTVPRVSVQPGSPRGAELQQLLALGFLVADGDQYRMHVALDSGRLLVNGAPVPLNLSSPQTF